ncbi:polysaccharide pyruvyl transferase family protein [Microbacterium kyungheense]|uniref:Polysaccharide pyruvyl transferase WcaK-like protein n=1 Tax=Microbacterium kyungheense TaxID=1263636 RepID=A0A543FK67_9MICO|nr:polysaccharide pyruvyl transferase family protein [Microbacterium kyungheense]TQM34094.1 polysaccharide pyruvyl transferase WcaK-like protein [Microbacterium kyungheense]
MRKRSQPADHHPRSVYTILTGQYDNLGDSILRRAMVSQLARLGDWHVFIGRAPEDYVAALDLNDRTRVYRSRFRWLIAATRGMARRSSAVFVANPGEISSSWHEFLIGLTAVWLLAIGRFRANPGIRVGIGARDRQRPLSLGHELACRLARINIWRDQQSRDLFGRGHVAPDWAFALPASNAGEPRSFVALCYRADKPLPSPTALGAVQAWAADRGYQLVVVSQVRRDVEANRRLASSLGALHVGGTDRPLEQLEQDVRAMYARSVIVLGNRVHGLILGMVEGAAPGALLGHADMKTGRTLRAAGFDLAAIPGEADERELAIYLDHVLESRRELAPKMRAARDELTRIASQLSLHHSASPVD